MKSQLLVFLLLIAVSLSIKQFRNDPGKPPSYSFISQGTPRELASRAEMIPRIAIPPAHAMQTLIIPPPVPQGVISPAAKYIPYPSIPHWTRTHLPPPGKVIKTEEKPLNPKKGTRFNPFTAENAMENPEDKDKYFWFWFFYVTNEEKYIDFSEEEQDHTSEWYKHWSDFFAEHGEEEDVNYSSEIDTDSSWLNYWFFHLKIYRLQGIDFDDEGVIDTCSSWFNFWFFETDTNEDDRNEDQWGNLIDDQCEWLYYWYYEEDVDDDEFENAYFDEKSEGYKYWSIIYPDEPNERVLKPFEPT